ncbi:MAG: ATP-dependent protease LonB, partial [Firmicutes bacterium]|nr:ATP-dependent protease LonB [Bacillota bacterium]
EDGNIPTHIHDIFQNGLPADFRMVGATTRTSEEIPPAIRSRCLEIFFRSLLPDEIEKIASNASQKIGFPLEEGALNVIKRYATNGREAVNIIQIAGGIALTEGRKEILVRDIEWVIHSGQYTPRPERKINPQPQVGVVNGLAVYGPNMGTLSEVEATVIPIAEGTGKITVTGVVEEEEIGGNGKRVRRKSMACSSVENVVTVLRRVKDVDPRNYDIHVNFLGSGLVDGPSAGVTIATAIYSAIKGIPVDNTVAMTGEISIRGLVKPVGGVVAKVEAARQSGVKKVFIPKENYQEIFKNMEDINVVAVESLDEVIKGALMGQVETAEPKWESVPAALEIPAAAAFLSQEAAKS